MAPIWLALRIGLLLQAVGPLGACGASPWALHGKAALLRPPVPYDPGAEAAGEDMAAVGRRGLVAYPNFTPAYAGWHWRQKADPAAMQVRRDAYALAGKACQNAFYIWAEDSRLSATERALANAAAVNAPHNDRVWAVRFTCTAPPVRGEGDGAAAPSPEPGTAAAATKK